MTQPGPLSTEDRLPAMAAGIRLVIAVVELRLFGSLGGGTAGPDAPIGRLAVIGRALRERRLLHGSPRS